MIGYGYSDVNAGHTRSAIMRAALETIPSCPSCPAFISLLEHRHDVRLRAPQLTYSKQLAIKVASYCAASRMILS
jgi:hypothetical protein